MKRLGGILGMVPAAWLALALVTPTPVSTAAVDTANASIPVDPATSLEMQVSANCIAAEGTCFFDTSANLRGPHGVTGFPGDLWARQTTTLRTMDRSVYVDA
ncbi:MAG: hypothetical protein M3Y83_11490, partial [Actinomycetota bacterium]|nr:hypothetical protein [Actinomycetota bacterium]